MKGEDKKKTMIEIAAKKLVDFLRSPLAEEHFDEKGDRFSEAIMDRPSFGTGRLFL